MRLTQIYTLSILLPGLASSQQLLTDPGTAGPTLEIAHLYYDQYPAGITISRTGRKFSTYPPGLDPNNTNTGTSNKYNVAELFPNNTERAYPSVELNSPPGGAINYTTVPLSGANYATHLIGVQSAVVDPLDRLWILDTGRALTPQGILVPASVGGAKLMAVDLSTNKVIRTIIFPDSVAYPTSYFNDIRFDLSKGEGGEGVAYITDSSTEGSNGIVIVDLGSGESWRHLDGTPEVRPERGFVPYVWGSPMYSIPGPGQPSNTISVGADGIAISADGEDLFWGAVGGRSLYSIPTARLLDRSPASELLAQASVMNRGQRGFSDGFETDSNGLIYTGNMEHNAITFYSPKNSSVGLFVRDPRINWIDTMSIANDGFLYFTVNQLHLSSSTRQKPFVLFRARLLDNSTRVLLT